MSTIVKNLYWLCGDRFICIERKNEIIGAIEEESQTTVYDITGLDANGIYASINEGSVFDKSRQIFIHDGQIPDIKKLTGIVSAIPDGKTLIIIDSSHSSVSSTVDRRTVMYKKFKSNLELFEPVLQKTGFPSKKLIPQGKDLIKRFSNWKGSDSTLTKIFRMCGYDYGSTVQEIRKIRIFVNSDTRAMDAIGIVSGNQLSATENIVDAIFDGDLERSLEETYQIFINDDYDDGFMSFTGGILESLAFVAHCRMAKDRGYEDPEKIGEYVSEIWSKNGRPVDAMSVKKRLYFYKKRVDEVKLDQIFLAIKEGWESVNKYTSGVNRNAKHLAHSFVAKLAFSF